MRHVRQRYDENDFGTTNWNHEENIGAIRPPSPCHGTWLLCALLPFLRADKSAPWMGWSRTRGTLYQRPIYCVSLLLRDSCSIHSGSTLVQQERQQAGLLVVCGPSHCSMPLSSNPIDMRILDDARLCEHRNNTKTNPRPTIRTRRLRNHLGISLVGGSRTKTRRESRTKHWTGIV